jgi:murein DD-endopeptidase MepM/ murein hydrolase activator NlpD
MRSLFAAAAAAAAAALLLAPAATAHTDSPKQIAFVWPAQGLMTTTFGPQRDGRFHPGIDIGVLTSLVISATAPGIVVAVGEPPYFEGYGNIVLVDLGGGIQALYAHLSSWTVQVGDLVTEGQSLGVAGCTGWCTGTHLHFELRSNGEAFDPLPLLPPQAVTAT